MITLTIIIILIVVLVNKNKKTKPGVGTLESNNPNDYSSEASYINHEILMELDKPEPSLPRLINLRQRMKRLESGAVMGYQPASVGTNVVTTRPAASSNGGIVAALYAGSILLLAGVGGLVGSGQSALGLPLLILLAIMFYGSGIAMRKNEKFKSVCHVFVGIGMAIIPFIGVLIHNLTLIDPRLIWLILSLIGVPVLIYATYIMNNKIFSFFAIAGLVSLSCSMSSVMGLSVTAYFMLVMAIGIVCDLLQMSKISSKFGAMLDAVKVSGKWLPLATLIASLLAITQISEFQYLLMLTVIVAQLALDYWHDRGFVQEFLLRITVPAWVVLAVHLIIPTTLAIGATLAVVTAIELALSFAMSRFYSSQKAERDAVETAWLILIMLSFVMAGFLIADFQAPGIWTALICSLLVDVAIAISARSWYKNSGWYYALLPVGIMLPIAISQTVGLSADAAKVCCLSFYFAEMIGMAVLSWTAEDKMITGQMTNGYKGDILMTVSLIVLGLAAFIAKPAAWVAATACLVAASAFGARGWLKHSRPMAETSVYLATTSAVLLVLEFAAQLPGVWVHVLSAHLIFVGLTIASFIWDGEIKYRQAIASVCLLVILGAAALGGTTWAMILFMVEAIAILVYGLAIKQKPLWLTGTIALFLAVLWFTRDLSFVWPALMGLGIIATVVLMIARGDKKK